MAFHFVASDSPDAQAVLHKLRDRYGDAGPQHANVIVALGGDGFMLQTLHSFLGNGIPIYGMNFGSIGFLMNEFREDDLPQRLEAATAARVHPLLMRAVSVRGTTDALAFNEVSLLRETRQAAKLRVILDGKARLNELVVKHTGQSIERVRRSRKLGVDEGSRAPLARRPATPSGPDTFRHLGTRKTPRKRHR